MSRPADTHAPLSRQEVDRLVVEHLPQMLGFAQRLAGNAHLAEDLVQEALCRVLKSWKSFRGEAGFSTWMMQIIVNVDRDRRRSQKPHQELDERETEAPRKDPNETLVATELHKKIQAAIQQLPERQREVAILCLGEQRSTKETAEILQITPANVHTCLHLARKQIAQAIGEGNASAKSH